MSDDTLLLVNNSALTENERKEIDLHIDGMIKKHRQDSTELSRMALDAASLSTAVESRASGMARQGILSRLWNTFTGKNQKLFASNQRDIAKAQYLSQQMLNKLLDQNLVQFEMMVAIEYKLNSLARDISDTNHKLLKVCKIMSAFFGKFKEMQADMEEFRRNNALLIWKGGIAYETVFEGKVYSQLNKEQKVVCLANDFYKKSRGRWNQEYMPFLKSVMSDVGLMPDEMIIPADVLKMMAEDDMLAQRLFNNTRYSIENLSPEAVDIPFCACLAKLEKLKGEENYLIEVVRKYSPDACQSEIRSQLALEHIKGLTDRDLERAIPCFDMVMELASDLSVSQFLIKQDEEEYSGKPDISEGETGTPSAAKKEVAEQKPRAPWWGTPPIISLKGSVNALCISPDGKILFGCSDEESVKMWDMETRKEVGGFAGGSNTRSLCISPDGKTLFAGEVGGIKIWDVDKRVSCGVFDGSNSPTPYKLCITPDGKTLLGCHDSYHPSDEKKHKDPEMLTYVWNIETRRFQNSGSNNYSADSPICISPDGKVLFRASPYDDLVYMWDVEFQRIIDRLELSENRGSPSITISSICISSDGNILFIGGEFDRRKGRYGIEVWDMKRRERLNTIYTAWKVTALCITPDDKRLVYGEENTGQIVFW